MNNGTIPEMNRRAFILKGAAVATAVGLAGPTALLGSRADGAGKGEGASAMEILMREHGVLDRLLLIYDRALLGIRAGSTDLSPEVVGRAADIVREFVQECHEKLEEEHVFPRLKQGRDRLVTVLLRQHEAGRVHNNRIRRLAVDEVMGSPQNRKDLVSSLQAFIAMYRPHKAWEDTVLFPAFHSVASPGEAASLARDFEKKEREMFGKDGYRAVLARVEELEKKLGIFDLGRFTPAI